MIPTLVWTLPRPPASRYKGGFPLYFEENLLQLLGWPDEVLHPFGGMAQFGVRVDLNPTVEPRPRTASHGHPQPRPGGPSVLPRCGLVTVGVRADRGDHLMKPRLLDLFCGAGGAVRSLLSHRRILHDFFPGRFGWGCSWWGQVNR